MSMLAQLNWRYATKKYDSSRKLPRADLDKILNAISLAPSASGYQPYDVVVVSNPDIREKLKAVAYNQSQVTEASYLLVFAAWANITEDNLGRVFDNLAAIRGTSETHAANRKSAIEGFAAKSQEENYQFAARQAFLGLGFAIAAAAELRVDATPMGGFNPDAFDEILELKKKGLRSVAIMALGYRDAKNDWLVNLKKVRRPMAEMFIEVK